MTPYLLWGTIFLLFATLIFYLVFLGFIYYWHVKKTTFVVVPLLFTFEFFAIAFFIVALVVILLNYFPELLTAAQSVQQ